MKYVELCCVVGGDNKNKYYKMQENGDGTWTATYGRVGSTENVKKYPISRWEAKYREKQIKGYQDVTALRTEVISKGFKDIQDSSIAELLNTLQKYSKQSILDNYTVAIKNVTQAQVKRAQELLDTLSTYLTPDRFNRYEIDQYLTSLYTVLPRKMKHVKDHILNGDGDLKKAKEILTTEQELVDNMASQVQLQTSDDGEQKTLEEALGLKIEKPTDPEIEEIKKLMDTDVILFKNAYKVTNVRTQKRFEESRGKCNKPWVKKLFHGSRNENWLSILQKGLMIRPSGVALTGAMFGNGVYAADKARKSIGYTSSKGSYWAKGTSNQAFLAIFEFLTGLELRVEKHEAWMYNLTEKQLKSKGPYDSLFAKGGYDLRNNEYIVYNEAQCTIKYIIEIKG